MEITQTTVEHLTFESVWVALQETDRMQKENTREMQKLRKFQKENAWRAERDRKDFNRRLGAMTNLFGDVTEAMITPQICEKFYDFGFDFPQANPNARFNDRVNKISFEVDILLENGDKAMLIEVKTKLTMERIDKHIERMGKMRRYADLRGDKRTFLGAVAGIVIDDEVREYALGQGFYLIEPAGDNFNITPPNGEAKEW